MKRPKRGSSGQATVEMALVLPILIWLLIGLVDVARMASSLFLVQHAAREAVRLGITGASDQQIEARALASVPTLERNRLRVTVTPTGAKRTGSDVTVTVVYEYKVLALMGVWGENVPMTARLTARVE